MDLLDQADDVAHPEDARGHTIRVERLQGLGLLTDAHENNGFARDLAHRECGTPSGVTVCLGQNHTRQVQRCTESACGIDSVLSRHGVNHEEALVRADRGVDLLDLGHQLFVDVQTTGGIDDENVVNASFRLFKRGASDVCRAVLRLGREVVGAHLRGKAFELQHGRRTADVSTDEEYALTLSLDQPASQFGGGGRFACPLQTGQQDDHRRLGPQIDAGPGATHQFDQFLVQDADESLARGEARGHLDAHSLRLDGIDEAADDGKRYIRFQEGNPHFTQGRADILFRDAPAPPEAVQGAREPGRQIVEHGTDYRQKWALGPGGLLH